ncbi:MAG: Signal peptidase [Verrucomicrobiota bacterium]|jgi:signal peptidase I
MIFRWFLSKKVRHAVDACRHVERMVRAQRDLLPEGHAERVREAVREVRRVAASGDLKELDGVLENLEKVVQKHLRPYPSPAWRENIEVLLVTGAVVLALRTFFVQPMAIPTGSAQPTLWGIVSTNLKEEPDAVVPGALRRWTVDKWWHGISYLHVVARADGALRDLGRASLVFPFIKKQTLTVGDQRYTVYFPSSFSSVQDQARNAGDDLRIGRVYRKGEPIVSLKVVAGDHLFVNRMIYNFRPPHRGEIIVFSSAGMPALIQDTHYIKRLVGLPGERVQIGNDRHLIIDGKRLDASTPGFENVYSFDPSRPPRRDEYSGHVNNFVARQAIPPGYQRNIAPLFDDENSVYVVPPKRYLPMGDNTMNSHDGRAWGAFPQEQLVGRSSFVFWPISERFGWGYR